jgi:hypothetical protein
MIRALRDGVEFARATFTVATLGLGDFPRGLSGTFELANFPQAGKNTHVQWQESLQSFVITGVENPPTGGCVNIAGVWTDEEEIEVTCTVDGESETITSSEEVEVTIKQDGCNVILESDEGIELGIPPRTGVIKGNQLQGMGKFIFLVPGGPNLEFTSNSTTYQGTINGNRIELTGSARATGKVCQDGECAKFSCTGTSIGLFTR